MSVVSRVSWIASALCLTLVATAPAHAGKVKRVSRGVGSTESNGASFGLSASKNGRFVVFSSAATNLVTGDTNGVMDVFLYDRKKKKTKLISRSWDGGVANDISAEPSISADGRFMSFSSAASNLIENDANGSADIFLYDRKTKLMTRVSVSSAGVESDHNSFDAAISADGTAVCFTSSAGNLVAGDVNADRDVFHHDLITSITRRVSVSTAGAEANSESFGPVISADGRFVAFTSDADNLVAGDTTTAFGDIFLHDVIDSTTSRVSLGVGATESDGHSLARWISEDGDQIMFYSIATNLVAGDSNGAADVFLHRVTASTTERLSETPEGVEGDSSSVGGMLAKGGRFLVFSSQASNLVSGDTNGTYDVFVRDFKKGTIYRASVAKGGVEADAIVTESTMSGNGKWIMFSSDATNLVSDDTNLASDVFMTRRNKK